jgi:hypothetical protein
LRHCRIAQQKTVRRQKLQIREPGWRLCQQHHGVWREPSLFRPRYRNLAANNRLHAFPNAILRKFQRAEKIAGIGDRHRRHARIAPSLSEYAECTRRCTNPASVMP